MSCCREIFLFSIRLIRQNIQQLFGTKSKTYSMRIKNLLCQLCHPRFIICVHKYNLFLRVAKTIPKLKRENMTYLHVMKLH